MKNNKKQITYVLMAAGLFPLAITFMMGVYNIIFHGDWDMSALLGDPASLVCSGDRYCSVWPRFCLMDAD